MKAIDWLTGGHGGADTGENEKEGDDELHHQRLEDVRLESLRDGADGNLRHDKLIRYIVTQLTN